MAGFISVRIEGGAKLRKALRRLNPATNRRIVSQSLKDIAVLISANARQTQLLKGQGPVQPSQLTNRSFALRNSIKIDFAGLPEFAEVGSDTPAVPYASIHEFGLGRFKKRAFMAPALDAISPQIPAIFIKHWKRALRR